MPVCLADRQTCTRRLIGETRTATIAGGRLIGMHIAREGDGLAAGSRTEARLTRRMGRRGIARTAAGEELLVDPWPSGRSEGERVPLDIVRSAWPEPGRERLAKARPAATVNARPAQGDSPMQHSPGSDWPEWLDDAWDDAFEAAELGLWPFTGGRLLLSPTPAFLAVDVDGAADKLAEPALLALAEVIRLWGLGGSIVIDLPDSDRATRQQAAAAFDRQMAGLPFERTAINGFGLMQVVRPRTGPSVLERARLDRVGSDAVQVLNSALRDQGHGPLQLNVRPAVARWIESRPQLLAELQQRSGRRATLRVDAL